MTAGILFFETLLGDTAASAGASGMSDLQLLMWCGLMLLGFAGSALFSGMETGCYRLNRVRLFVRAARRERSAVILDTLIHRPAALLGTLLVGNNMANYLGTAALGIILGSLALSDWQVIVVNTLLVSILLLIFGETLPKDFFASNADRFMYPLARPLRLLHGLFTVTLVLPLVVLFSKLAVRLFGGGPARISSPRKRVVEMVRHGAGYGLLSDEQSAMAQRAFALSNREVGGEATPWAKVQTIRGHQNVDKLIGIARQSKHSRFPVLDAKGHIVGTIDVIDTLADGEPGHRKVSELMRPVVSVPETKTIRYALTQLQREHIGLAIVTGLAGRPVGVVTVKDLVEPLTGEIADW
ncbi:MAG: CNNM domain-containing protein [Phycisphaerales bacterium JB063]